MFPGNRGGPLVHHKVCGLSALQKEGRHGERIAALVGKWATTAALPVMPQCRNIVSC